MNTNFTVQSVNRDTLVSFHYYAVEPVVLTSVRLQRRLEALNVQLLDYTELPLNVAILGEMALVITARIKGCSQEAIEHTKAILNKEIIRRKPRTHAQPVMQK